MVKIFQSILYFVVIYIDEILLFSSFSERHVKLLHQFHTIFKSMASCFSQRNMQIEKSSIDFLGLNIKVEQIMH
jgi:hypothetical protein